ncbi:hypothetical protein HPB47_023547 [Ixodes persulcatus]|uniref:Uncharacterized protein n=1 Tax=Ixodes persulcatus TaxID=34615 RepID=A0AC60Q789_IXOPE|nr:hypothetical protein HPB47_023547 [Ixodes persulcatus]
MQTSRLLQVFLAAALAVALPASSPLYDHPGDTPTWIHPPPVRVASDQPLPCPHFLQLTLAPNHLRIWQPGTTCDPREEGLQKPARSASQLGHDIAAGTVMQTSRLLQRPRRIPPGATPSLNCSVNVAREVRLSRRFFAEAAPPLRIKDSRTLRLRFV